MYIVFYDFDCSLIRFQQWEFQLKMYEGVDVMTKEIASVDFADVKFAFDYSA